MLLTKKKKANIIAGLLAAAMTASAAVSVSAATLTDKSNEGSTDVTAKILGEDEPEPGNVSYIITIPDKIDFGTLAQPDAITENHFKEVPFTVTATKVEGFTETGNWGVGVKVRDQNYEMDVNENFYISQKTVSYPDRPSAGNNQFQYYVFIGVSTDSIANNNKNENGINFAFFRATGQSVSGKLQLNQNLLYGKDIKDIAGEYSGSMVFHSSIVNSQSFRY